MAVDSVAMGGTVSGGEKTYRWDQKWPNETYFDWANRMKDNPNGVPANWNGNWRTWSKDYQQGVTGVVTPPASNNDTSIITNLPDPTLSGIPSGPAEGTPGYYDEATDPGGTLSTSTDMLPGETPDQYYDRMQYVWAKEDKAWNDKQRPYVLADLGLIDDPYQGDIRPLTEEEKMYGVMKDPVTGKLIARDESNWREHRDTSAFSPAYMGMTPDELSSYKTQKLVAKRAGLAAEGKLYYDPNNPNADRPEGSMALPTYVTDAINENKKMTGLAASQRLGAKGAKASTAGINLNAAADTNAAATIGAYGFGQEQQGMGLLNNFSNYLGNIQTRNQNVYGQTSNAGLGLIPQFQMAQQPYTFGRKLSDDREIMELNRQTGRDRGILQGFGTGLSMYAMGR